MLVIRYLFVLVFTRLASYSLSLSLSVSLISSTLCGSVLVHSFTESSQKDVSVVVGFAAAVVVRANVPSIIDSIVRYAYNGAMTVAGRRRCRHSRLARHLILGQSRSALALAVLSAHACGLETRIRAFLRSQARHSNAHSHTQTERQHHTQTRANADAETRER